jgi:hypothetical protein
MSQVVAEEIFTAISIDSLDNTITLNPIRRIEFDEESQLESENNEIIVKHRMCCCTFKKCMEYVTVAAITAIFIIVGQYIVALLESR